VEIMIASEKSSRMSQEKAARERDVENAARERREAEQRKQFAEKNAALTDLQSAALDFLGKPAGAEEDSISGQTLGQFHMPLPPSFPMSTSPTLDRDASPLIELPPLVYQVIGLAGQNIKEAPLKLGEAVITALGYGSQLSVIKITKGLSDEAGRSMQNAVDLIGRGYPEAETVNQIKGSEFRAMKIYVDSFSSLPTPLSEEEQQALEINGRRWFNWLTQQQEGGDK
ncbi:MAG: hypothetical protein K9N55_12045, partial [Phycisphaerae bacterium]|nr:hypothetical protein [Phycisphaerae bacterium]